MRRGRPNIREEVHSTIMKTLFLNQTPLTTSTISRFVSGELKRKISWNTTFKYIEELVGVGKIQPITLPHSKTPKKDGLRVYILKR